MKFITRFLRLLRIQWVFLRYNLDSLLFEEHPFFLVRFLLLFNPYYWLQNKNQSRGERLRLALQELGPLFVKAGQILSTRRDILPDDIAIDLEQLQDRVPPFDGIRAKHIVETSLKQPIHAVFSSFDIEPLASASIAQVHAATLLTGDSVVVKILRPRIKKMIENDIDLLMTLAKTVERYVKGARIFKPQEIVAEIANTLLDEVDFMKEGANASQLKRLAKNGLHIPRVYWDYSRDAILVMERIHGIPIYDTNRLRDAGINLAQLANTALSMCLTQIFHDRFFHADLHPGNIFVSTHNSNNPSIILVDFGIVGALSASDQHYIAENMLAFFKRDYQRVAELHIASGWLASDTRIDQFASAIRAVSEPIFEQPLSKVSFGLLLLRLFQVARRFKINIQPQLVLLQKTLLNIEGLCRQLNPEMDLWAQATPDIEKWLKEQMGFKAFLKRIKQALPAWSTQLPELPGLLHDALKAIKESQTK